MTAATREILNDDTCLSWRRWLLIGALNYNGHLSHRHGREKYR
jgi:hypothetical protein